MAETATSGVIDPDTGLWVNCRPCPFCGCNTIQASRQFDGMLLKCWNCGATGPDWDHSFERAVQSWNYNWKPSEA